MSTIAIVPKDADNNHMARVWSLAAVARSAGYAVHVDASSPDEIWAPLRALAASEWSIGDAVPQDTAAVVSAVPLAATFDRARQLAQDRCVPLLVDCDEAHWEAVHGYSTPRRARRAIRWSLDGRDPRPGYRTRSRVRRRPVIFSSPYSSPLFTPAAIIPHVRPTVADAAPALDEVVIAFVGTPRAHKGMHWLREESRRHGHRLVVTADRPVDATSNEEWLGGLPQSAIAEVLARCNVVALPSHPTGLGATQLPAKAVEAMAYGLALVATDLPPIRWAAADAATYFAPGDRSGFSAALGAMTPARAEKMGETGLDRARRLFTPEANAGVLHALLEHAAGHTGT